MSELESELSVLESANCGSCAHSVYESELDVACPTDQNSFFICPKRLVCLNSLSRDFRKIVSLTHSCQFYAHSECENLRTAPNEDSDLVGFELSDDYDYIGDLKKSMRSILRECQRIRDQAPAGTAINRNMSLFADFMRSELGEMLDDES